jgi:hypothetical protein
VEFRVAVRLSRDMICLRLAVFERTNRNENSASQRNKLKSAVGITVISAEKLHPCKMRKDGAPGIFATPFSWVASFDAPIGRLAFPGAGAAKRTGRNLCYCSAYLDGSPQVYQAVGRSLPIGPAPLHARQRSPYGLSCERITVDQIDGSSCT